MSMHGNIDFVAYLNSPEGVAFRKKIAEYDGMHTRHHDEGSAGSVDADTHTSRSTVGRGEPHLHYT